MDKSEEKSRIHWIYDIANNGNVEAQNFLGYCYQNGIFVEDDIRESINWYTKAAEQGDTKSQMIVANLLLDCEQNYVEAIHWYRKLAEQGSVEAMVELAVHYYTKKNYKEAVKWYKKAADQGDVDAQYIVGYCYENGLGVEENLLKARNHYVEAAKQEDYKAMWRLEYYVPFNIKLFFNNILDYFTKTNSSKN